MTETQKTECWCGHDESEHQEDGCHGLMVGNSKDAAETCTCSKFRLRKELTQKQRDAIAADPDAVEAENTEWVIP